ncbi:ribbon-helix-helix domain-containing protein [Kocuria rhizophila]|uniref:ribbon-helix-helix domain-containing protein n=1 Tax=Kocuria rhizophila TaxID=72000 RepID=UPI0028AB825E|nr:ribbon-helix-helix domain-containing protein [Kocuria rhizophila]WSQ04823.1 ribbon-helix-helix domain-containing protein [Kocuria rhizophila]
MNTDPKRVNVRMPLEMIHRMDVLRSLTGTSRSGFIRLAVADYLKPLNTEGDQS